MPTRQKRFWVPLGTPLSWEMLGVPESDEIVSFALCFTRGVKNGLTGIALNPAGTQLPACVQVNDFRIQDDGLPMVWLPETGLAVDYKGIAYPILEVEKVKDAKVLLIFTYPPLEFAGGPIVHRDNLWLDDGAV